MIARLAVVAGSVAVVAGTWALLIWLIVTYGWMGILIYLGIAVGVGALMGIISSLFAV
jgi:hypothetical protein